MGIVFVGAIILIMILMTEIKNVCTSSIHFFSFIKRYAVHGNENKNKDFDDAVDNEICDKKDDHNNWN